MKNMIRARRKKPGILSRHGGFTLMEILITVMIVSLMTVMLVTGIQVAMRSYSKMIDQTNAQVLLSTGVTMLRTELSYAKEIKVENNENHTITYKRGESNYVIMLECRGSDAATAAADAKQIYITEYGNARPFPGPITATNGLCLEYSDIEYNETENIVVISGLQVTKPGSTVVLAELEELVIENN